MPLYPNIEAQIRSQLEKISRGEPVGLIDIGEFTADQLAAINRQKLQKGLPIVESAVITFKGKHLYNSRTKDGYTIEDMIDQLRSGLSEDSVVTVTLKMTALQNLTGRQDGYGNHVRDKIVFECTLRWPKAEAFSVIPKGDANPPKAKAPLLRGLS